MVSVARGSPTERDPSVWTCVTNDSLIDDGPTTGEPLTGANRSLGGSSRSDIVHACDSGGFGDCGGRETAESAYETST